MSEHVMIEQWIAAGVVLAILGGLILGLRWARTRFNLQPETTRKMLHIGMGSVALSFPWVFNNALPVVVLAAVAVALLGALRRFSMLKARLGGVIDVDRASEGELYFPIGIAVAFWLTGGDPILYCIPIAILTLADAVAALVGVRYGMARYATVDGSKSVEGSLAFFLMAYFCTQVPLLLYSQIGRAESLLIGLIVGVLIMLVEAVAWRGLDNLLIPVLGLLLLSTFLKLSVAELLVNLGVLAAIAVFTFVFRSRTTLDDNALLSAVLIGYVMWALGGWTWLYPPALLFLQDRLHNFRRPEAEGRRHNVQSVLASCMPGLFWLVFYSTTRNDVFFFPYVLTFAAHWAIFELTRLVHVNAAAPRPRLFVRAVLTGWLMFVPYVAIMHFSRLSLLLALVAVVPIALVTGGFLLAQPGLDDCPRDMARWLRQGAGALIASALGIVPLVWSASLHA